MASAQVVSHPSDEVLELYLLERLPDNSLVSLEEHLLVCQGCQDRLVDIESYIQTMKRLCRENLEAGRSPKRSGLLSRVMLVPVPAWGAAAAVLAIAVSVPLLRDSREAPETEVHLSASRGERQAAASGGRVRLTFDAVELPPLPAYRVAVVSVSGDRIWEGEVAASGPVLTVSPEARLRSGNYWVRVSSPGGEPLREMSLAVE